MGREIIGFGGKGKKCFSISFEEKNEGEETDQDVSIKWQKNTTLHSSPFPVANKMPPAERNIIRVFSPLVVARVSQGGGETGVSAGDPKNSKKTPLRSTHDAKDSAFFAPAMKRERERDCCLLVILEEGGRAHFLLNRGLNRRMRREKKTLNPVYQTNKKSFQWIILFRNSVLNEKTNSNNVKRKQQILLKSYY